MPFDGDPWAAAAVALVMAAGGEVALGKLTKRLAKAAAAFPGATKQTKPARRAAAAGTLAALANAGAASSDGPSTSAAGPRRLLKVDGDGQDASVRLAKAGRKLAKATEKAAGGGGGRANDAPPPAPLPQPTTPATAASPPRKRAAAADAADPPSAPARPSRKKKKATAPPALPPPPPAPTPNSAAAARAASLAAALPSAAREAVAAAADAALAPAPPGPDGVGAGTLPSWRASSSRPDLVKGRFSADEKATLVAAAHAYAAAKGLPTGGGDWAWLFATRAKGPDRAATAGAWKVISSALPHRSPKAVCAAGTRLLHPGNFQGAWSAAETARLVAAVAEKGPRWTEIGGALGRLPEGCRDRWKEVRLGAGRARGRWAPDEEERLAAAVAADLRRKAAAAPGAAAAGPLSASPTALPPLAATAQGAADDGQALDGVSWAAVSAAVRTRSPLQCMAKWYEGLAPSLAERGEWGGAEDDAALLRGVMAAGRDGGPADWAGLVPGRSGAATAARWRSVRKLVPGHGDMGAVAVALALAWEWMPDLLEEMGG